jgi:uncharacterized membrane protein
MSENGKDILRSVAISVGMAMTIFCVVGVIFDIMYKGQFSLDNYRFTKMVLGCLIVGLGFGVPTVIYRKENLPMPIRVLVHMGTGCVIYTIVAFAVGWIGGSKSLVHGLLIAAVQIAVAFVIWYLFNRYYRREARKMNDRIQEMK